MKIELLTTDLLNSLSDSAKLSDRLRKNYNFHQHNDDPCHRLLNAVELNTYVPPHCHQALDETMIIVRGKMGLIFFDAKGKLVQQCVLEPASNCVGVNIPKGVFHSLVALEPNTIFFESKAGPYQPLTAAEKAPFAPPADHPDTEVYLQQLYALFAKHVKQEN